MIDSVFPASHVKEARLASLGCSRPRVSRDKSSLVVVVM